MNTSILIFACLLFVANEGYRKQISFGTAVVKKTISYRVSAGQMANRRMKLAIKNNTNEAGNVQLETGRIFYADHENTQPFVVTNGMNIQLDAKEERVLWIQARCGNSSASSPKDNFTFNETKMGPAKMVAILELMNKQKISSTQFYQNVVWHFTNNHNLASVTATDVDVEAKKLIIEQICKLEGKSPAWYSMSYEDSPDGDDLSFSGIPKLAKGELKFYNPERENIQVQLTDLNGNLLNTLELFVNYPQGKTLIPIEIDLKTLKTGNYNVRVINAQNTILENWKLDVS